MSVIETSLDACAKRPLLADGAMGTQLMIAGLEQGNCGEAWNVEDRDRVLGSSAGMRRPGRTAS